MKCPPTGSGNSNPAGPQEAFSFDWKSHIPGCIGVVAEYNPFHNGHAWQLQQARQIKGYEKSPVIVVMSGDFVQRGEPALLSKWNRASAAVQNGADIVLELPAVYALSSAGIFADGAVKTLMSTGMVSAICFGCETADLNILRYLSRIIAEESHLFKDTLASCLSQGYSFPQARCRAITEVIRHERRYDMTDDEIEKLIRSPNLILALEYIKASENRIPVHPVKRLHAEYHDQQMAQKPAEPDNFSSSAIASATAIRKALKNGHSPEDFVPSETMKDLLNTDEIVFPHHLSSMLRTALITSSPESLRLDPDVVEGLEFRLIEAGRNHSTWSDIVQAASCRRYTATRISRISARLITGLSSCYADLLQKTPVYARVLASNATGHKVLRAMDSKAGLPIFTRISSWRSKLEKWEKKSDNKADVQMFYQSLKMDLRSSAIRNIFLKKHLYDTEITMEPGFHEKAGPGNQKHHNQKRKKGEKFY